MTKNTLKYLQNLSLDKKIAITNKIIINAQKKHKMAISFSGGKDSTVLMDLAKKIDKNIQLVFADTTNEHPLIYQFIKTIPDVIWLKPQITFNEYLEQYGFPLVSKRMCRVIRDFKTESPRNKRTCDLNRAFKFNNPKWFFLKDEPFDISAKCCDILKKNPLSKYAKQHNLRYFDGMTTAEGGVRKNSILRNGYNSKRISPLFFWVKQDILAYISKFNLSISKAYETEERTGCLFCGMGAHLEKSNQTTLNRFQRIKKHYPKRFIKVMNIKNNGITFREALEKVNVNLK